MKIDTVPRTIPMDSDRILVLDDGKVMEIDSPGKLLENSDGYLYHLVNQTGHSTKKKLMELAKY